MASSFRTWPNRSIWLRKDNLKDIYGFSSNSEKFDDVENWPCDMAHVKIRMFSKSS